MRPKKGKRNNETTKERGERFGWFVVRARFNHQKLYKNAYVYFQTWFDNDAAINLRNKIAINGYNKMRFYNDANTLANLITSFSNLKKQPKNCNVSVDSKFIKEYEQVQENYRKNPFCYSR